MPDLSYALRNLRRTPGFAFIAIFILALGIGATTAVFSIVDAVLLHPLPYPHPDRLVAIWEKLDRDPNGPPVFDSYRDFQVWQRGAHSFEQLAPATWANASRIVTGAGPAQGVLAMPVGLDFFAMFGMAPELGRTFQAPDLGGGCTVVLSHRFWEQAFQGDRNVTARRIALDQDACTIAGVMPAAFQFYPEATRMWVLITPNSPIARDPENANVGVFGRLRPGATFEAASREVAMLRRADGRVDEAGSERAPVVFSLAEQFAYVTGPTLRLTVALLFGAVCFVLLIACVNLANLLLGRSLLRRKELAVRVALGAGRRRLVRQLLTETLLLSSAGALGGIVLAELAVRGFRAWNPIDMPPGNPVTVNPMVLAFAAGLAILTAIVSGLLPALRASRVDPIDALKAGGRGASFGPRHGRTARVLAGAQVMLSISLLAGAGLLIESVNRMGSVSMGFRSSHVFSVMVSLPKWAYTDESHRARFYRDALNRVPGAAFVNSLPMNGGRFSSQTLVVEGRPEPAPGARRDTAEILVSADYFQVMDVRLKRGRFPACPECKEQVAVINEALARKYFPNEDPVGKHIRLADKKWLTITGVVGNEKDRNFFREMTWEEMPFVYRPIEQKTPGSANLLVRGAAVAPVLAALRSIDPGVPVSDAEPLDARVAKVLAYPRFRALVLGGFAALALLLAGVGLYGVLAQSTAQRTHEFGIRFALGAERGDVLRLVIRQGILLTGVGLALGLIVAFAVTRLLGSLLYGIRATDPLIWCGVSLVLGLVALLAMWLPASRASRVDPTEALRYE